MVFLFLTLFSSYFSHATGPARTEATICSDCVKQSSVLTSKQVEISSEMACRADMDAHFCEDFFAKNPNAKSKRRDCAKERETPFKSKMKLEVQEYYSCLKGLGESVADIVLLPVTFATMDTALTQEIIDREDFFRPYEFVYDQDSGYKVERPKSQEKIVKEKYELLGPYAQWFKKEEIEGHKDPKINCRDVVNQNYCFGKSTSVLYREMLERMKREIKPGQKLSDPWVLPWTGKEFDRKNLQTRSMQGWMTDKLEEFDVRLACYNSQARSQLECYAFFMVVNPIAAISLASKVLKVAGVIVKAKPAGMSRLTEVDQVMVGETKGLKNSTPSGAEVRNSFEAKFRGGLIRPEKKVGDNYFPPFKATNQRRLYHSISTIKDPKIRETTKKVYDRMVDQNAWNKYISQLQNDIRAEMLKSKNLEVQAAAKAGFLTRNEMHRVLANRANARGAKLQKVPYGNDDKGFDELVASEDNFVDWFTFADHGRDTHAIQRDFVAPLVIDELGIRAGDFWKTVAETSYSTREGKYVKRSTALTRPWNEIFDASNVDVLRLQELEVVVENPTKPEWLAEHLKQFLPTR